MDKKLLVEEDRAHEGSFDVMAVWVEGTIEMEGLVASCTSKESRDAAFRLLSGNCEKPSVSTPQQG